MKVVAIDLDGTLLSEDLTIHEENVRAIKKAQQQGSIVSIATGRALFDAQNIIEKAKLNCPIIGSNGAQIYIDNKKIDEQFMKQPITQPMIQWMNKENMYYQLYLSEEIVVSDQGIDQLEEELHEVIKQDPSFNKDHFWQSIQANIDQFGLREVSGRIQSAEYDSIVKLMVVSPDKSKLKRAKEVFNQLDGCSVSSSGEFNLEIMSVGVDKGIGLYKLCDYYGTTLKNTVVIGDNLNDVPMFEVAGMGIAMGNAEEELIKMASFKTLPNNECGVAYAFHKYIQGTEMVSNDLTGS